MRLEGGAFLAKLACALATLSIAVSAAAQRGDAEEPWRFTATSTNLTSRSGERVYTLVGDVVIRHGDLEANADSALYLTEVRRTVLTGHVVMTQDSTTVRAPVAFYDRVKRVAHFPEGLVIERPSGTAVADRGIWHRDEGRFELRGHAAAADTSGTLDADAMTYEVTPGVFYASADVRLVDDATGVIVECENLRYDRTAGLAEAFGEPAAIFEDDDGVPVRVMSERLTYEPRDNVARAYGGVRIRREAMEASADSAAFFRDEGRSVLMGSPELVDGATVVGGRTIEFTMTRGGRRSVVVRGEARVSNRFLEEKKKDEGEKAEDGAEPGAQSKDKIEEIVAEARSKVEKAIEAIEDQDAPSEELEEAEPGDASAAPLPREKFDRAAVETETGAGGARESPSGGAGGAAPEESLERPEKAASGDSSKVSEVDQGEVAEKGPPRPAWLEIPGDRLPEENLLFGEEIRMSFVDDELEHVVVIGSGRSKFFPNEDAGELTEWNDVAGDTLRVWFTESSVDSVHVIGNGSGQYRFPAGEDRGRPVEELKREGKLVEYRAPKIRYLREQETMHLDGGAEARYKTMVLTSGSIDFDAAKETMFAQKDPVLVDEKDEIHGDRMNYHLPSERGEIVLGRTKFENGFYSGRDVWKIGDKVLAVDHAIYTTCDLAEPHYHFACRNMKIYLDERMVARPVVFKIKSIPVFALPFYMTSLKKGRHSGFLLPNLELGVDDRRGRFIRNFGYYWAPNDYMDTAVSFDFYPGQDRIVSYLNTRYNLRYRCEGRAAIKYNRDVPRKLRETAVELEHRQTFSETMRLTADARFVSSSSIYQNIDDVQRLDRELQSHATLSKQFAGSRNLRVDFRRRENLENGRINETLPTIEYSQPSQALKRGEDTQSEEGGTGGGLLDDLYYGVNGLFVSVRDKDTTGVEERHVGSRTNLDLRSTVDVSRYLRISPSVDTEGVWIDEDRLGERNAFRGTFGTSLTARTELYGTVLRPIGPIQGLRHVVRPNVSWRWSPEFDQYFFTDSTGVRQDRFFAFGGIGGTPGETNSMTLGLNNLIQTKIGAGEQVRRYDLFNFQQSIGHNFLAGRWSNLSSSLTVLSAAPINQTWTVAHDPYDGDLLNSSVTTRARISSTSFSRKSREDSPAGDAPDGSGAALDAEASPSPRAASPGGEWALDISHTASRTPGRNGIAGQGSSQLVVSSRWSPTENWNVSYNTQYDLQDGINTSQSWSVRRRLHTCWELSFDRRLLGGEWQYYFRVALVDIPDIQLERGDRFGGRGGLGALGRLAGGDLY